MPMFDRLCDQCSAEKFDVLEPSVTPDPVCACGGRLRRAWLSKPPAAIGDECDVWIKHGLCNEDGSPRRYRHKSEIAFEAKARGMMNYVRHVGTKGGDKSKHTTRWF